MASTKLKKYQKIVGETPEEINKQSVRIEKKTALAVYEDQIRIRALELLKSENFTVADSQLTDPLRKQKEIKKITRIIESRTPKKFEKTTKRNRIKNATKFEKQPFNNIMKTGIDAKNKSSKLHRKEKNKKQGQSKA